MFSNSRSCSWAHPVLFIYIVELHSDTATSIRIFMTCLDVVKLFFRRNNSLIMHFSCLLSSFNHVGLAEWIIFFLTMHQTVFVSERVRFICLFVCFLAWWCPLSLALTYLWTSNLQLAHNITKSTSSTLQSLLILYLLHLSQNNKGTGITWL